MSVSDTNKNINHSFPAESKEGMIKRIDKKIMYEGNQISSPSEITIDNLQYAYIVVRENKQAFLFLFDHHQHYIPVTYAGFKDVYEELSGQFGFNDVLFFDALNSNEIIKKEIWRRTYEPTYEILQSTYTDYDKGFEIQSPDKRFISWDTTYEELAKNPYVHVAESPYIQKIIAFAYPVRVGNILLKDFHSYYDAVREDVTVLQFYCACYDRQGTDKSFTDLKARLLKDFGIDRNRLNYDRADQKNLTYNFDFMSLSICYTYDSEWQFNAGYTAVSIENKCDYFSLLIDQAYEDSMVISDYLLLAGDARVSEDYKRNSRIKRRPQKITDQFKNKTLIWIDDRNNKIGFSSKLFSQVFHADEIESFYIQNTLPARGTGSSYLALMLHNQKDQYIVMKGSCNAFDVYADNIKALTHKEVVFGVDDIDC